MSVDYSIRLNVRLSYMQKITGNVVQSRRVRTNSRKLCQRLPMSWMQAASGRANIRCMRHLVFSLPDNSCTVYRANCSLCCSTRIGHENRSRTRGRESVLPSQRMLVRESWRVLACRSLRCGSQKSLDVWQTAFVDRDDVSRRHTGLIDSFRLGLRYTAVNSRATHQRRQPPPFRSSSAIAGLS